MTFKERPGGYSTWPVYMCLAIMLGAGATALSSRSDWLWAFMMGAGAVLFTVVSLVFRQFDREYDREMSSSPYNPSSEVAKQMSTIWVLDASILVLTLGFFSWTFHLFGVGPTSEDALFLSSLGYLLPVVLLMYYRRRIKRMASSRINFPSEEAAEK